MEKINIAELLKDCPKGMELDCTLFDGVLFDEVVDDEDLDCPILIRTKEGETWNLTREGCWDDSPSAKCVIFPKGKTTWEGFTPPCQFKDGDIVATSTGTWIGITTGGLKNRFIPTYCVIKSNGTFEAYLEIKENWGFTRLATEEEKQKLFKAIKDNGYKWNAETKTLEKLPKFKVGNIVRSKNYPAAGSFVIVGVKEDSYSINLKNYCIKFKDQDNYELVPNKFDISTLNSFDKVLVRLTKDGVWHATFFSHYDKEVKWGCYPFVTTSSKSYSMCIPYNEDTKHLTGTNNDCDEYYKNW